MMGLLPTPAGGVIAPGGPARALMPGSGADLASLFAALVDAAQPPEVTDTAGEPAAPTDEEPEAAPADMLLALPAWLLTPPPPPQPQLIAAPAAVLPDPAERPVTTMAVDADVVALPATAAEAPALAETGAEVAAPDMVEPLLTGPAAPAPAQVSVAAVEAAPRAFAAELARQLAPVLPRVAADGGDTVLTLDPASLGRITLRWITDGDGAPLIRMVAERADTMALLAAHEGGLNRMLGGDGQAAPQLRVDRVTAPAPADSTAFAAGGSADGNARDSRAPTHQPPPTQGFTRRAVKSQQRAGEADQATTPPPPRRAERFA